ncbi:hypothetical protein ACLMJK_008738 [Lecanora helva]
MNRLEFALREASICLRCRCRLNLQKRLRLQNQRRFQPNRHFALGRRLDQEQAELHKNHDEVDGMRIRYYGLDENDPITRSEFSSPRRAGQYSYRPPPRGKLGVNSLGEPAEVLILREWRREDVDDETALNDQSIEAENDSAMTSQDMLNEMNAERGIVDIEQVCKNIDNVRDQWYQECDFLREVGEDAGTTKNWGEIRSRLFKGFTLKQLAEYSKRTASTETVDPLDLHRKYSCDLYTRSSWQAGVADFVDRDQKDKNTRDRLKRAATHKWSFVDRILGHWKIRPPGAALSLGTMDISLRPEHLELVVKHERRILKQISQTYGAKVEASPQDQTIRVTSDCETSLDILKLIEQTLESIKRAFIQLSPESVSNLKFPSLATDSAKAMMNHIMQSTNTVIRFKAWPQSDRGIVVYYLGPSDSDLEDVRRFISQSSRQASAKDTSLLVGRFARRTKVQFVPIDVGNGLSLMDRSQGWTRWCSRSIRAVDPSNKPEGISSQVNTTEKPLRDTRIHRALSQFFAIPQHEYEAAKKTKSNWVSKISYWDSALLGQVIFPSYSKPNLKLSTRLRPQFDINKSFTTQVPGLLTSLENLGLENLDTRTYSNDFILIRLTPSPSTTNSSFPTALATLLPDLEIRIFFDHVTHTSSIRDVRLVRRKELDLLLPSNTMDLRFIRRSCVYSRKRGLDPAIASFIESSNLDIWGTGRLKTPNSLLISIPPHSLGPLPAGVSADGVENEPVEYTFASLEHNSELGVPFRQPGSWADLTYTCIEGGRIGGRRDELGMKQPREPSKAIHTASGENAVATDINEKDEEENLEDLSGERVEGQAAEHEGKEVDDESHSTSLLKKAGALIYAIEHQTFHRPEKGNKVIRHIHGNVARVRRVVPETGISRVRRIRGSGLSAQSVGGDMSPSSGRQVRQFSKTTAFQTSSPSPTPSPARDKKTKAKKTWREVRTNVKRLQRITPQAESTKTGMECPVRYYVVK